MPDANKPIYSYMSNNKALLKKTLEAIKVNSELAVLLQKEESTGKLILLQGGQPVVDDAAGGGDAGHLPGGGAEDSPDSA